MKEKKSFSELEIPEERKELLERLQKIILGERLVELKLSRANLNSNTEFEKNLPLFFGIGGGNHEVSKALPFDALSLILTAEKLKRELRLGSCSIFLADQTTALINGFSERKMNGLMLGIKEILKISLTNLGFQEWNIFIESELEKDRGLDFKDKYEEIAKDALCLDPNGYCARETAATIMFLPLGGIKLGWCAPGSSLDEMFFDNQTKEYLKHRDISNKITFTYTPAGVRLFPGETGQLERVAPYICSQSKKRILLSPFEDPVKKIKEAAQKRGGLEWRWSRRLFSGIVQLFEELVLPQDKKIPTSGRQEFKGQKTAEKMAFILSYLYKGHEAEAKKVWQRTFP